MRSKGWLQEADAADAAAQGCGSLDGVATAVTAPLWGQGGGHGAGTCWWVRLSRVPATAVIKAVCGMKGMRVLVLSWRARLQGPSRDGAVRQVVVRTNPRRGGPWPKIAPTPHPPGQGTSVRTRQAEASPPGHLVTSDVSGGPSNNHQTCSSSYPTSSKRVWERDQPAR